MLASKEEETEKEEWKGSFSINYSISKEITNLYLEFGDTTRYMIKSVSN